jgi:hypothetical protein
MSQGSTRLKALAALLLLFSPAARAQQAPAPAQATNNAPLPDERLGVRTVPILLLSRPDVRSDLMLTPEQSKKAETAITDFWVSADAVKGKKGAAAMEARKEVDRRLSLWFEANLTSAQRTRLLQIDLQWEGPSALLRPVVADTLGLSPRQRESIGGFMKTCREERATKAFTATRELELNRAALKALDPSQLTRWRAMIGVPFTPQLTAAKAPETTTK